MRENIEMLESRRSAYDAAMWQIPTLTLIAQSFLLIVLLDGSLSLAAAILVLLAAVGLMKVAALALWQLHDREEQYSRRIAVAMAANGELDPRNEQIERSGPARLLDVPVRWMWPVVFALFALADLLVLLGSQ